MGEEHSLDSFHVHCVPVMAELCEDTGTHFLTIRKQGAELVTSLLW